jgi:hypothetical protein
MSYTWACLRSPIGTSETGGSIGTRIPIWDKILEAPKRKLLDPTKKGEVFMGDRYNNSDVIKTSLTNLRV